jgi:hypothetical protein
LGGLQAFCAVNDKPTCLRLCSFKEQFVAVRAAYKDIFIFGCMAHLLSSVALLAWGTEEKTLQNNLWCYIHLQLNG